MNATLSKILICLAVFSMVSCARAEKRADNGFDQICQIYKQVLTDPSHKSQTQGKKMIVIYKRIHKTVTSKFALNAFDSFMTADPKTRYGALKKIAEYELKHSWDCPIINTIK